MELCIDNIISRSTVQDHGFCFSLKNENPLTGTAIVLPAPVQKQEISFSFSASLEAIGFTLTAEKIFRFSVSVAGGFFQSAKRVLRFVKAASKAVFSRCLSKISRTAPAVSAVRRL